MRRMIPVNQWEQVKKLLENSIIKMEVTNIKSMTKAQLDELQCGDIVAKITGKQKHCYIVTYKGEGAGQGICLSYCAAGYMETVSYDRSGANWVYNSTDVVEVPAAPVQTTVTVESTDWSSEVATVAVTGLKTTSIVLVSEDPNEGRENYEAVRDAEIIPTCSTNGQLTLTAKTAPETDIKLNVVILG